MTFTAILLAFLGIIVLVFGISAIAFGFTELDSEYFLIGFIAVLVAVLLFTFSAAAVNTEIDNSSDEWVLKEEAFLAPVSDNRYLLEGETNYIYQKKLPSGNTEPEMVQDNEYTEIEVKSIASNEEPYVQKYERTISGEKEYKYVFYVPQS